MYPIAYRPDLYDRIMVLHQGEVQGKIPPPNFLANQTEITDHHRYILVKWMAEVNDEFNVKEAPMEEATLHLAINLVDRFLALKPIVKGKLQLLGTTAHHIASKFEDVHPPKINDFCAACDGAYTRDQVKAMESIILTTLGFRLHVPTSLSFAAYYWNLLMTGTSIGHYLDTSEKIDQAWKQIVTKLRAQLMKATYAERKPSGLAAIAISHTLLENKIPQEIVGSTIYRLSGYQIPDVEIERLTEQIRSFSLKDH